jgi:hypothetical protein
MTFVCVFDLVFNNLLAAPAPSTNKELHTYTAHEPPNSTNPTRPVWKNPIRPYQYVGRTQAKIYDPQQKIRLATSRFFDPKADPTRQDPKIIHNKSDLIRSKNNT